MQHTELSADTQDKFAVLEHLDFVKQGQNVVLEGNPGNGKAHLTIGLGLEEYLADFSILFTTMPQINRISQDVVSFFFPSWIKTFLNLTPGSEGNNFVISI